MAIYRERPIDPVIVKAVEWTGENTEEVEDFLGNRFEAVDGGYLWYKSSDFIRLAIPGDMIYFDDNCNFQNEKKEKFLENWELIEE